jgi:RNA polymerase sigma-70 factor (ECF subfamily)
MNDRKDANNELQELIKLASGGDVNAFRSIVDKTSRFAFGLAYKTLFNTENAKDVVQESFIRVWKHLDEYKPEIKFTTWLYKIVMNLCYDKIKSNKRNNLLFENYFEESEHPSFADSTNIEENISNSDAINIVINLANGLSQKQRMVFILRDLNSLTVEEVSQVMNISAGAVKSNLFYARKFISQKFSLLENKKELK